MRKSLLVLSLLMVSAVLISLPETGAETTTHDREGRKVGWGGSDATVTIVTIEANDTIVNKFTGREAYWFDMVLDGCVITGDNVDLDFRIEPNYLTNLVTMPLFEGFKEDFFNSTYAFMGEDATEDNILAARQEVFDIPFRLLKGDVLSTLPKFTFNQSYSMTVELEAANTALRQARFKFGSNSFVWTISTQTEWEDNTLTSENIVISDGTISLSSTTGDWGYKKPITIDSDTVENENFTNFPFLLSITDSDLQARLEFENAQDLRFMNSAENENLAYELENYDNSTGELVAWVSIPTLYDNENTIFYMYYGNASATNQENAAGVWDDNYVGVWHMNALPNYQRTQVSQSSDDAEESLADGSVDVTSSDLEMVSNGADNQVVGIRFEDIDIAQGATISSAYIQFTVKGTDSDATSLIFRGDDNDNAATFVEVNYHITSRDNTTASVNWDDIPEWDTTEDTKVTPNLAPIIQEIIDRPGWVSGNALAILIFGTGDRTAYSYDTTAQGSPLLVINELVESSSNDILGVQHDEGEPLDNSGKIAGGQAFDGSDDNMRVEDDNDLDVIDTITLEVWARIDAITGDHFMIDKQVNSTNWNYSLSTSNADSDLRFMYYAGGYHYHRSTTNVTPGTWQYYAYTVDFDSTHMSYIDGDSTGDEIFFGSSGTPAIGTGDLTLGIGGNNAYPFDGQIDEVRISDTLRSSAYIKTRYLIENNPSDAVSVGAENALVILATTGTWESVNWELYTYSTIDNLVLDMSTDLIGEFDLSENISNPFGLDFYDPGNWWYIVDAVDSRMKQFTEDWTFNGQTAPLTNLPTGFCIEEDSFLICDSANSEIDNYTIGGVFQGDFDVSGEMTDINDIFYMPQEDNRYVLSQDENRVFVYNTRDNYTGTFFTLEEPFVEAIHYDNSYWYSVGATDYIVYRYDNDFTSPAPIRNVGADDAIPRDIYSDGENLFYIGNGTDTVYQYSLSSDNIYARIGYDSDNDNTLDNYSEWYLMPDNGYWINPDIPDAYNYNVSFRLETDITTASPSISSFTLNADYSRDWRSVENWFDNINVLPKVWQTASSWRNRFVITAPFTPLYPIEDTIYNLIVPLVLLFAPALALMTVLGTIGFIMGLGVGSILVFSISGFSFGSLTLLIVAIVVLWYKSQG